MSVKIEESGRRSIQVEVEVPGAPEKVWQAIATGPGVSAWFVPTEIEEHEGGAIVSHFGPGMESRAKVTAWEPPHRFTAKRRLGRSACQHRVRLADVLPQPADVSVSGAQEVLGPCSHQNAVTSARPQSWPGGLWYVFRAPVRVSVTLSVYSTSERAP